MKDYHINIFWSDEDGGYIADIPDLAACSAFGDTPALALAEVERAREAWLAAARAEGKTIPEARYRPHVHPAILNPIPGLERTFAAHAPCDDPARWGVACYGVLRRRPAGAYTGFVR